MPAPTRDQIDAITESLRAGGVSYMRALRAAGVTLGAMAAACDADPMLQEELREAERVGKEKPPPAPVKPAEAPVPTGWADVAQASAEAQAPPPEPGDEEDLGDGDDENENRWSLVRAEAAKCFGPGMFGLLLWLDAKLVAAGFPPISPWWLAFARTFYASGKRWAVVLAGRGAGKSTVLTRVAVVEGIFGERSIPPGQRWIWPFISVGIPDARRRILEIQAILTAIGIMGLDKQGNLVPLEPSYPQGVPTIETEDASGNPIAFVALAGTIAGVSGPSSIGATIDEEAKLRDKAANANPATEILASLVQTFRGRPGIHAIRCSSAWEEAGSHHGSIVAGSNLVNHVASIGAEFLPVVLAGHEEVARWEEAHGNPKGAAQIRAFAAALTADSPNVPTWLGNPTIAPITSRIDVEALPPDALDGIDRTTYWLRENGSQPQPVGGAASHPLADVVPVSNDAPPWWRVVVAGIAPGWPEWGIVLVASADDGRIYVSRDLSGRMDSGGAIDAVSEAGHPISVLCVASRHEKALSAEVAAWLAGRPGAYLPPVAPQSIHDGDELRVGPLRTLYQRGQLRHVPGLADLEIEARGYHLEGPRPVRLEALCAAVTRLVTCYPWLGGQTEEQAIRGPRPIEAVQLGGPSHQDATLDRLGARVGRDGI
jgi:hypothetical protein